MSLGSYSQKLIEAYKSTVAGLDSAEQEARDSVKVYIAIKVINDFANNAFKIVEVASIVNNSIESQFGTLAVLNYVKSIRSNIIKHHGGDSNYESQINQVIKGLKETKSPEYDLIKSTGLELSIPLLDDLIDLRNSVIELLEYSDSD